MIHLKNKSEIDKMYCVGQIVKDTLYLIEEHIKPGITTFELDEIAENFIRKNKAIPGFKGLYGFPGTLCVSIDDEVVHGIPSNRVLKEGEIILLENIRFFKEETEDDQIFSKKLGSLGDIYINDAFSCSHRKQASIHNITKFIKN